MATIIQTCSNCERRLPSEAKFCPHCGHSTSDAIITESLDTPTLQSASTRNNSASWQVMLVRPDGEQTVNAIRDKLTIGRSPQNDLQLDDEMVSRFHAQILKDGQEYLISDLESMNGTMVNRKAITAPQPLKIGDAITIGEHRLLIQKKTFNCGNCRRKADLDDVFCRNCGEPLTGVKKPRIEGVEEEGTQRIK